MPTPPPVAPDVHHGRRFLAAAAVTLLLCLALSEVFCLWAERSGFWYRRMNPVADITSRSELDARLRWGANQPHALFALGDSVLGPTALMQARRHAARESTLSVRLGEEAAREGATVVHLGADGLLLPDLEALARRLGATRPEGVLLLLNFRMFAPEFDSGDASRSRPYLDPALSAKDASTRIEGFLLEHSSFYRTTRLLRTLWYHPSQKEFFQRLLEKVFHMASGDSDMQQAALVMKTAPYYPDHPWRADGAPLRTLPKLLDGLRALGIPAMVVLTPQNGAFLGGRFDKKAFEGNRKLLGKAVAPHLGPTVRYLDWSDRLDRSAFLDHCHLTPEGNRRLAADLWAAWDALKKEGTRHE